MGIAADVEDETYRRRKLIKHLVLEDHIRNKEELHRKCVAAGFDCSRQTVYKDYKLLDRFCDDYGEYDQVDSEVHYRKDISLLDKLIKRFRDEPRTIAVLVKAKSQLMKDRKSSRIKNSLHGKSSKDPGISSEKEGVKIVIGDPKVKKEKNSRN